jgi:hypothetical protein
LIHSLPAYPRSLLVAMHTTGPDEQNVMVSIEGLDVAELSVRGAFAVEPLCDPGDADIKQHYYVLRSVRVYCLWRDHVDPFASTGRLTGEVAVPLLVRQSRTNL